MTRSSFLSLRKSPTLWSFFPGQGGKGGGGSGGSGGLTSGNAPASQKGARRFSSVDMRDDSNLIVQSIYNLVG